MLLPYKGVSAQRRRWALGCLLVILVGIFLVITPAGGGMEVLSYDLPFIFRGRVANTNIVVVLEDRAALGALNERSWPPSRKVHAQLIDRLRQEGARLVVFDILFLKEIPDEDQALSQAIRLAGNVILGGANVTSSYQVGDNPGADIEQVMPPPPLLQTNAIAWGVVPAPKDQTSSVNTIETTTGQCDSVVWIAANQIAGTNGLREPKLAERWINYYGANPVFDSVSLSEALELSGNKAPPNVFRGKVVFIGADPSIEVTSGKRDIFITPYSRFGRPLCPGVELLANEFANLCDHSWLRRIGDFGQCTLMLVTGLLFTSALIRFRRFWYLAVPGLLIFYFAGVFFFWLRFGVWFNWLAPVLVQLPLAGTVALVCPFYPVVAFISYRRKGGNHFALMLVQTMWLRGKDVLLDVNDLPSGPFPEKLTGMIEKAPCFIMVLSPGALDTVAVEGDWLRKEISCAFRLKKRIVPVLIDGFKFPEDRDLPEEIRGLPKCQAIIHHHDQWAATIDKLEKYLLE